MTGPYDDLLYLPHHVSDRHAPLPLVDRGAQFSPFAALTGYDAVIRETGRHTLVRTELDESQKSMLNEQICMLLEALEHHPEVTITYFRPDERKDGGSYLHITGKLFKIDAYGHTLILEDETEIPVEDITEIQSGIFPDF